MNRQQEHLFTMLKEIHQICVDNNITYYLAMGSLIGAVRNGGFLPWDDDADILMTRDEFERFKEVCESGGLPPNRALCSSRTVESFGFLLPRYISTETTAIHTAQSLHEDVSGEVIDIFLLDPIADGDEAYRNYVADVCLYSEIINYANVCSSRISMPVELFDEYNAIREKEGIIGVSNALEKRLERNFDENGHDYVWRWNGVTVRMDRAWFDGTTTVTFEGSEFLAPIGLNEFLTRHYGDEWTEVPARINPSKHNTAASLRFPYSEAREFYQPAEDLVALKEDMYRRKRLILGYAPEQNALKNAEVKAKATLAKLELEKILSEQGNELEKAFADKDGRVASDILKPFIDVQLSCEMIGRQIYDGMVRLVWPILIDNNPHVLETMLLALMCTERVSKADRMLEVWRLNGQARTPYMDHVARLIERFRTASCCYEHKEIERGLSLARELHEELPKSTSFIKLTCVFLLEIAEEQPDKANIDELEAASSQGLALAPHDGFFLKMNADCLRLGGDSETASKLYLKAAELTHNGYIMRDIFRLTGYHPSWYRKPEWAQAYGIEQWEGEEPAVETAPVAEGAGDGRQQLLFTLLKELCGFCDEHNISYVLAPTTTKALAEHETLPAKASEYAIVCMPHEALKLVEQLAPELPAGRTLDFFGNNGNIHDLALRYGAAGSLYLKLDVNSPAPVSALAVQVYVPSQAIKTDFISRVRRRLRRLSGTSSETKASHIKRYKARAQDTGATSAPVPAGGKKTVTVTSSTFENARRLDYAGFSFAVPAEIATYTAKAVINAPATSLNCGKVDIASASFTLDDIKGADGFSEDYYKRKAALTQRQEATKATYRRFARNYKSLKLAVALKELSLELMPQKERICELADAGDIDTLKELLGPYIKLAKKYKNVGTLEFDPEIYAALKLAQVK